MDIGIMRKKLKWIFTPIALSVLSWPAFATPGMVPPGWQAHPPIHLKSPIATLLPSGFSPNSIKTAYGFPAALQGAGQVIGIVDAYDNPNIEADLNVFSTTFGLPACTTANGCFKKVYASGSQPTGDSGWGLEMSLDVEWAHAIAPLAKIVLVEAADNGQSLFDAVNVAIANHATVISLSWGSVEWSGESSMDYIFKNSPVPIVVSSGDAGAGASYPAASPYVLSAGGTQLNVDANGNYLSETAWNGSGGGISAYEQEPSYQSGFPIPQNNGKGRGIPDIAYNASPSTGFSVYDSYGISGWLVVGGTSASAPQWAALIAVMNSARGTNLTGFNSAIYNAAHTTSSTLFHDITSGQNGSCGYFCQAQIGYDYVTGFGTPKATNLIAFFNNTCVRSNPSLTFSPTSQTTPAGGGVSYNVKVLDNDNTACGASNFNLQSALPAGLSGGLSQNLLTLSPGGSSTVTLQVNSTATTPTATYTVSATATNSSATSSSTTASASYIITGASKQNYAYTVYVGYPFHPVVINSTLTCPNAGNPACLVGNQAVGSAMTIIGTSPHKCSLDVQANGNLTVDENASNSCNVGIIAATNTRAGSVALPSKF